MCQVKLIRPGHSLVTIPIDKAIYCKKCRNITNSPYERCGRCGSEFVLRVAILVDQPPSGPDSGPASTGCIVSDFHLEVARAA
jgi:hypothetical protein